LKLAVGKKLFLRHANAKKTFSATAVVRFLGIGVSAKNFSEHWREILKPINYFRGFFIISLAVILLLFPSANLRGKCPFPPIK
jgi:hypothetical protein